MEWNTNSCKFTTFLVLVLTITVLFQICESQRTTKNAVTKVPKTSPKKAVSTEPTVASSTTDDSINCGNDDGSCLSSSVVEQIQNVTGSALGTSTSLTTEAPVNESLLLPKSEVLKHIQMEPYEQSEEDFCVCNLQLNYCDLNCCCDKDCSYRDKLVFDHCQPELRYSDSRYCDYTEYIYVNNTPHEWHVNQNGLFCVIRSNLPPTYTVQTKQPIASTNEAEILKSKRYSWPHPSKREMNLNISQTYQYGSALWIIRNFLDLQKFCIPNNFVTHACIINEDVKYLVDIKTSCSVHEITENLSKVSAETYFKNITVVSSLLKINKTMVTTNNFTGCPKNVCIPLEPYLCQPNLIVSECTKLVLNVSSNNTGGQVAECFFSISSRTYSCRNLVRAVKYEIFHDGIGGVKKAKVFLALSNLTLHLGDNLEFPQDFQVDFLWWTNRTSFGSSNDYSVNFTRLLSGNPGYLTGKPILIAKLITGWHFLSNNNSGANSSTTPDTNNTTGRSYYMHPKVYRNPWSFQSNFMVFPRNVNGDCRLTQTEYYAVEFGFHVFTKCRMKEVFPNTRRNNSTPADICKQVQKKILHDYWSLHLTNDTLANKLIGKFGNANTHHRDDWIHVLFKQDLQDVLNYTWGKFTNENRTVNCGNITTLLIVDFFHSRIDFEHLLNQEKILGTTITFGDFVELSFDYNKSSPDFEVSTKISEQVMFYDVTSTKVKKFVDPPSFSIRLPYDFFYPFVRINNKGVGLCPTMYGIFLSVLSVTVTLL